MVFVRRYEEPDPQRVNRWLAQSGVCSRREADALIAQGLVSIDGETISDAGRKIAHGQTLTLAEAGQVPAIRLLTRRALYGSSPMIPDRDTRLAPVGRLDMSSRGLLLLSDDGVVAKAVIGPASTLDKEYRVAVMGELTQRKLELLRFGLELDDRKLKPAEVEVISDRRLRVVLREGRNRQIRRMCELVDLKVVDLFRVRIGRLTLGDMPEGRWRPLTADERTALIAEAM
jgi:23S rRNA pseudouridine2604 synthase